jgi:hypothetical protein
MAVAIFALTQGLKWILVKPWTNKISNETVKKSINTVIFFFPYAVGITLEILVSVYITHKTPDLFIGAINGGAGHSVFHLYERCFDIVKGLFSKKKSHAKTDEEKAVEELVFGIVEDNKVDKTDHTALEAFLKKVK